MAVIVLLSFGLGWFGWKMREAERRDAQNSDFFVLAARKSLMTGCFTGICTEILQRLNQCGGEFDVSCSPHHDDIILLPREDKSLRFYLSCRFEPYSQNSF